MSSPTTTSKYIVLMGDVGSGKSTILERLTGVTNKSSSSEESFTRATEVFSTKDQSLLIADTPGSNSTDEPFKHNLHIMHAINFMPVNLILIVVKADTRMDNVLKTITEYALKFIPEELPEELLGVCVTHMDNVKWSNEKFRHVLKKKLRIESVVFFELKTSKTELKDAIIKEIGKKSARDITIDDNLFLKIFDITDGNLKIMRHTRNEVQRLRQLTECFYRERTQFEKEDQIDLIFEFQAWVTEEIINAQKRVSDSNNFDYLGPEYASEAGHIANMTNQLKKIVSSIRVEASKYHREVESDFRKCPHCSLVWQRIEGCEGPTTCGARPKEKFLDFGRKTNHMATFSYKISRSDKDEYKLRVVKHNEKPQVEEDSQDQRGKGVGCNKSIKWSTMAPVKVPPEAFDPSAMDVSYAGDIKQLPSKVQGEFSKKFKEESEKLPTLVVQQGNE